MNATLITAFASILVAVIAAVAALWANYAQKQDQIKTVNKAILAEISRLLQVLCSHYAWWLNCIKYNTINLPIVPFNTDVYDNFLKNIGDLDDSYASNAVGFYGFVKFLNSLQKLRTEYTKINEEKEFARTYEAALHNSIKNYRDKFDKAFKFFDVNVPVMTHCDTSIEVRSEKLTLPKK